MVDLSIVTLVYQRVYQHWWEIKIPWSLADWWEIICIFLIFIIEIVDLHLIYPLTMVDLSIVFCMFTRPGKHGHLMEGTAPERRSAAQEQFWGLGDLADWSPGSPGPRGPRGPAPRSEVVLESLIWGNDHKSINADVYTTIYNYNYIYTYIYM